MLHHCAIYQHLVSLEIFWNNSNCSYIAYAFELNTIYIFRSVDGILHWEKFEFNLESRKYWTAIRKINIFILTYLISTYFFTKNIIQMTRKFCPPTGCFFLAPAEGDFAGRTNRQTNGRMNGQTNGRADGRTDGRTTGLRELDLDFVVIKMF